MLFSTLDKGPVKLKWLNQSRKEVYIYITATGNIAKHTTPLVKMVLVFRTVQVYPTALVFAENIKPNITLKYEVIQQ
jgi:hypothetical protein